MSERPLPPEDYECCESACDPCVWDIYYQELQQWQQEQQQLSEKTPPVSTETAGETPQ